MVLQAYLVLPVPYFIFSKVIVTGAKRINALNQVHKRVYGLETGKRAVVFTAILN
jgi:predicted DsbA family dithiol-disulfide isomerase